MKKIILLVFIAIILNIVFAESNEEIDDSGLLGILYHQTAAEYMALCFQAYNAAEDQISNYDLTSLEKPPAIILDVDETVLGNSRFNARELLGKAAYPDGFYNWLDSMEADAIYGALDFLNYADSLGIAIFYITNRNQKAHQSTVGNLQKHGFPQAIDNHVFCRQKESSKEGRRQNVAEDYEVLLLVGDNLIDFADCFADREMESRFAAVEKMQEYFGRRFIVLPNMMHGFWIKLINDFRYDITPEEKKEMRLKLLKY